MVDGTKYGVIVHFLVTCPISVVGPWRYNNFVFQDYSVQNKYTSAISLFLLYVSRPIDRSHFVSDYVTRVIRRIIA